MKVRIFILGVFLLLNCKDPVEIRGTGNIGALVIDGRINTLPGPYNVNIGLTVGLDQKPNPVSGATVTVYDDAGNSEDYVETTPGVYSCPGVSVQGTAGRSYHIEVTLANGSKYSSKPETIPDATGTDTPTYEFSTRSTFVGDVETKTTVVNVYTDTDLPPVGPKPYYFRWYVTETYMFEQSPEFDEFTGTIPKPCYISGNADPQRITLYNTKNQVATKRSHILVASRDLDYAFLAKYYFNVYLNAVTPESYNYWQHVDQLINRSGSIFDAPPAPIKGNISSVTNDDEVVFGYFEASNTSLKRMPLLRGDIPYSIFPRCNDPKYGPYWTGYPKGCKNCLLLDNSTKTPPDWWLEIN